MARLAYRLKGEHGIGGKLPQVKATKLNRKQTTLGYAAERNWLVSGRVASWLRSIFFVLESDMSDP